MSEPAALTMPWQMDPWYASQWPYVTRPVTVMMGPELHVVGLGSQMALSFGSIACRAASREAFLTCKHEQHTIKKGHNNSAEII